MNRKHLTVCQGWYCRGGVPVCFPQFGDMGPCKAQHGFARNTEFTVDHSAADSVTLSLKPTQEQLQGDFPKHTLIIKVLIALQAAFLLCLSAIALP